MEEVKRCTACEKTRPTAFYSRLRDGYQSACKACLNAAGRKNYQENKSRYVSIARARDEQIDRLIVSRKSVPCTDCHKTYPPYVMHFDHIANDKEFNISAMRRRKMALSKIEAEMAKCEVVCANCHAERSNTRRPSTRYAKILGGSL